MIKNRQNHMELLMELAREQEEVDFSNRIATLRNEIKTTDRAMLDVEFTKFGLFCIEELSDKVSDFGIGLDEARIGQFVQFTGFKTIKIIDVLTNQIKNIEMNGVIGSIMMGTNKCVVISTEHGFFGWVDLNKCRLLNVVPTNYQYLN